MNRIPYSESKLEDIEEALPVEDPPPLPRKKLTALLMVAKGPTQSDVAKVIDNDERTVRAYCNEFRERGISSVVDDRQHRPSSSLEPHYDSISKSFQASPPSTSSEAATRMAAISVATSAPATRER